jgi:hypothetical protein
MRRSPRPSSSCAARRGVRVVYERCLHRTPFAFVPFIIPWGSDASSDMPGRSALCTKCGHKGAVLRHPSWAGRHIGFEPFPTTRQQSADDHRGVIFSTASLTASC